MFVLTTLVYPVVLALLCVGAGLLVYRASATDLPAMLLPVVGAAALIVVSQITTYLTPVAPATPYLLVVVALAGWVLGRGRVRMLVGAWRTSAWQVVIGPLVYALALAPVLLAGRPTLSSYMALADSAVHMLGADFLIAHGQDYSHLDLGNSYGATMHAYYGSSYPSGADTLLGGSAFLLRLPAIWAFQPLTAFMLATATGPAWVLARRVGLECAWAAMAALTIALPALVYAYELIGSIKEIVALPLVLGMGALVVTHRRWLWGGARAAIPFALLVAAGVAALGPAFGVWALAAALVLATVAVVELLRAKHSGRVPTMGEPVAQTTLPHARVGQPFLQNPQTPEDLASAGLYVRDSAEPASAAGRAPTPRRLAVLLGVGAFTLLVAAWPTWADLSGSLHVAQAIASTSNPGNLHAPLRPAQLLGIWFGGSYKLLPSGTALTLTYVLVALVLALALVGVGNAVRTGRYALAGWFALLIVVWLLLSKYATTWADAKTLVLTSPAVILMTWAGIAAMRSSALRLGAPLVAVLLVGGVLVSDALQYHESNLAPTARYEELASVNRRFAGRGPALFDDFDEYALYVLRDLDVGGPSFAHPPPALARVGGGYARPVALDRIAPRKLAAYPLIVMRRDPTSVRPPVAYRLLWQGSYYEVWGRRTGARPALAHVSIDGPPNASRAQCVRVAKRLVPRARGGRLLAALAPTLVTAPIPRLRFYRPPGWARARRGILMRRAGTLRIAFGLPHGGLWQLWLQADIMRELRVSIDGHALGSLAGQLGGNSLVANTLSPLRVRLSAGPHTIAIARPGIGLAPGDGGAAVLSAILLTPVGPAGEPALRVVHAGGVRSLCARPLQWVELESVSVPAKSRH
jgi:hypothetical protein